MSIGLVVNKGQLDNVVGILARNLKITFDDVVNLNIYLVATADADLIALGYTSNEVATIKSAYADAAQLASIFTGAASLAEAKDFRAFLKLLWGLGDIAV